MSKLVARHSGRYDRPNDATGSTEAGNGRDSIGQRADSGQGSVEFDGPLGALRWQDRWRQNVS